LSSITCQQRVTLSALSPTRAYSAAKVDETVHRGPRRAATGLRRARPAALRQSECDIDKAAGRIADASASTQILATYSGALPLTTHAVAAYDLRPSSSPSR